MSVSPCSTRSRFVSWLALLALLPGAVLAAGVRVTYPANESLTDTRFNDLIEILDTALRRSTPEFGPYELAPSHTPMNEARYLVELNRSEQLVNIIWSSTSVEKERDLLPLRIPLRKGILGYRVALISKDRQGLIDQVKTASDLKKLTLGQGIGWGDVKLYEANGLTVVTAQYDRLFKMTELKRFDLFPRGISEVFAEHQTHAPQLPGLAIEKNLLIYYPWPYYFFFNKRDEHLRDRIEAGLRLMMKDGSFDAIFNKYNGPAIEKAKLNLRRVIQLHNPLLPKETPLNNASLWFDPTRH